MDSMLRAADRDRDEVAELLREHYAQGRLTIEEFDERSTAAATAKTMGDLRALTADLPVTATPAPAEPRTAAWSPSAMRLIAVAGVIATAILLGGAAIAGHFMLAWPSWLAILFVLRLTHGRRRIPRAGGPRARRG
jgi:hypothetical protein